MLMFKRTCNYYYVAPTFGFYQYKQNFNCYSNEDLKENKYVTISVTFLLISCLKIKIYLYLPKKERKNR